MVYRGLYSYWQQVRIITLFPNIFFHIVSACWASLQRFLKGKSDVYKYLNCLMQRVHFQVQVGVFNCQQQILTKNSFVIFDIVVKTNRMWFSIVCTLIDKICCGLAPLCLMSPQRFDHCDDAYCWLLKTAMKCQLILSFCGGTCTV